MLACIGDLIDDIVVRTNGDIRHATDTGAMIQRRQGGSAANVAVAAAKAGSPVRFIGQVGDDSVGRALVDELAVLGVDVDHTTTDGETGTIVVIVDPSGERTMLTDRRACLGLANPQADWLDDVTVLHIPLYSLVEGSLAATSMTLARWAADRGIAISVDASSSAVIETLGRAEARARIGSVAPAVLFANEDEARALKLDAAFESSITVVKRGSEPSTILRAGERPLVVAADSIGFVADTTGAGDAFAAGFLTYQSPGRGASGRASWDTDPLSAVRRAHEVAANHLRSR